MKTTQRLSIVCLVLILIQPTIFAADRPRYSDIKRKVQKYLKRDYKGAKANFEKVHSLIPGDKPAKLYLNSCEDYIVIPPPENWDGVFNLTSK